MNLSANTLFHFTPKLEYLLGILKNGFIPRYCLEDISFHYPPEIRRPLESVSLAIPMVCFCDIRLTQAKQHASTYGKFIIGMTKDWGIRNGISPVTYFHEESLTAHHIGHVISGLGTSIHKLTGRTYEQLRLGGNVGFDDLSASLDYAMALLCGMAFYYKPISGSQFVRGERKFLYFYDEREWRYFPYPEESCSDFRPTLLEREFQDEVFRFEEQKKLEICNLIFTEADIKYIVIPDKGHINDFRNNFEALSVPFNYSSIASKLKFYNEIAEDH